MLYSLVRPIGKSDHIALDQFDRAIDQARCQSIGDNQLQSSHGVVVGVAFRWIVIEQAHFQGRH